MRAFRPALSPIPNPEPQALFATLPPCRSSRSRSSPGTKSANIRAALESVAWADEIVVVDSESTDDTVAIARAVHRARGRAAVAGYAAQKNFAASIWRSRLDPVARRRRAGDAGAGGGDPRDARRRPATWRLPDSASDAGTSDGGSARPTGTRTISCACTIGAPRAGRARTCTSRSRSTGSIGRLPERAAALPVSRHRRSPRDDRSLHDAGRPRRCTTSGRRAGLLQIGGHPPLAFLRNYLLRGGFRDGVPGLIISALNAYYVFLKFAKLWQLQHSTGATEHATGAAEHPTGPPSTLQTLHHALTMFSLHIDTARTWRGGQNQVLLTVNGLREIGHRAALVAHPDGELRRRASRGARADSDRAADRDGPVGRLASRARRSSGCGRTSSTPTIRTASRWPSLALSFARRRRRRRRSSPRAASTST